MGKVKIWYIKTTFINREGKEKNEVYEIMITNDNEKDILFGGIKLKNAFERFPSLDRLERFLRENHLMHKYWDDIQAHQGVEFCGEWFSLCYNFQKGSAS
ncbi:MULTISPECIES: hypothetical protein [Bacteria]|uniref:Uncharacterized protein n=4 Tax=Bacillus cereus group TaxID=86661 RepID=A0A0J1HXA6_BACAN|nr:MULTISPECIES: hypothetical protein [Bacteria]HDR4587828.1 hypothetical protein [Bacillus cytotoxicus]AJI08778.1 hypothetical protein AK40_5728 [Bacillus cereus 03BB108]EDX59995.1 hypothetical protein BC03BB108_B0033 [Bacillus cereus 03BB108]EOQ19648.1 hypothetical protein IKC_04122 [Bacillus cereus VD184]KLV18319.1 hypothetical protein ABW01_13130 [Bacillus anthracis]